MSGQRQATGIIGYLNGASGPQPVAGRSPSRAGRLLLAFFLLFAVATVCVAAATVFPLAHLTDGTPVLADAWRRLLSITPWRSSLQPSTDQDGAAKQPGGRLMPLPAAASTEDSGAISYGDRLKITFFESAGVALASGDANSSLVPVVFPRMDLTGEYAVDEKGRLDIPKLGQVVAAGKSITALQSELGRAFERAMGRTSDVHVVTTDRLPIYVMGAVRAAGTFKYVPGMIVMQVLAGAGGLDRAAADTSRVIEDIRETGRLRLAESTLDRLLVHRARLLAQQGDSETITVPASIASRLSQSGSHDRLNSLIAAAQASLEADRKGYRDQQVLATRQIEVVKLELQAQQVQAGQLRDLLAKKENKLQQLKAIGQRGSIPEYKINDVEIEISELLARQASLNVAFAQTQRRLVEAESAQAKLKLDHAAGIERELSTTQQEIENNIQETASMQAVRQALHTSPGEAPSSGSTPDLTITRRVAGHLTVLHAVTTTAVLPGDVVQVDFNVRSGGGQIPGSNQRSADLQN